MLQYCSVIKRFHHEPLGSHLLNEKLIALSWSAAVIIRHHLQTASRGMLLASSRISLNLENFRTFQRFLKNLLLGEKNYSICSQTSCFSLMFLNIWFNLFNMFNFDLISYAESSSPFDYPIQLEVKSAKLISLQLYYNIYFKFSWGYFCSLVSLQSNSIHPFKSRNVQLVGWRLSRSIIINHDSVTCKEAQTFFFYRKS